jgi:hypothetical protein
LTHSAAPGNTRCVHSNAPGSQIVADAGSQATREAMAWALVNQLREELAALAQEGPLDALRALADIARWADELARTAAAHARAAGATWTAVGAAVGTTRQAAYERFRNAANPADIADVVPSAPAEVPPEGDPSPSPAPKAGAHAPATAPARPSVAPHRPLVRLRHLLRLPWRLKDPGRRLAERRIRRRRIPPAGRRRAGPHRRRHDYSEISRRSPMPGPRSTPTLTPGWACWRWTAWSTLPPPGRRTARRAATGPTGRATNTCRRHWHQHLPIRRAGLTVTPSRFARFAGRPPWPLSPAGRRKAGAGNGLYRVDFGDDGLGRPGPAWWEENALRRVRPTPSRRS